ncbi:MAG TPA: hypothetical protein VFM43_05475 [Gaiellaceae bacterium]|nr:hypothetical protein [Gaiellaceae bacterium]
MTLLLVDDRDGRIVSEIETVDEAQRVLDAWVEDAGIPDYLCLVEVRSHDGAFFGTDTSVRVSPLSPF